MDELDLPLADGRTLRVRDTGGAARLTVLWQHGTPNIGTPPAPWAAQSQRLGIRWIGHDRPGYGGSTSLPGRDVASVVDDVAQLADALGLDRFAVVGHSGGGPHALACAARLPDRVTAALCVAGLAPHDAAGLAWYAGMGAADTASLRAAEGGRDARLAYEQVAPTFPEPDPVPADRRALAGRWRWLDTVTGPDAGAGPHGLVDDEVAFVTPWGFDPADLVVPTLLLHGAEDPVVPVTHSRWLAARCPAAELRVTPHDGHVSVLGAAGEALAWLLEH